MLEEQALNIGAMASPRSIVGVTAFNGMVEKLGAALGVALPATPVGVTRDGVLWLWSGPQSWLAVGGAPDLAEHLEETVGMLAAVVDQSDGRVVLRIAGPGARENLAKLIGIDLHERAFGEDATALTLAAHIPVQIWRTAEDFEICCFRSYAPALAEALAEAAR